MPVKKDITVRIKLDDKGDIAGTIKKIGNKAKESVAGVGQLEKQINKLKRSLDKANGSNASMGRSMSKVKIEALKSSNSINQLALKNKQLQKEVATATNKIDRMSEALRRKSQAAAKSSKDIDMLKRGAKALGAVMAVALVYSYAKAVAQVGIDAVKSADELRRLEARVGLIAGELDNGAESFKNLRDMADRLGQENKGVVNLFQSLERAGDGSELAQQQSERLVETLIKLGTISGASGEDMKNAYRQLGQGMSNGILMAEEYNSVIEQTPEVINKMREGYAKLTGEQKKTSGEFRKMMLDQEITSEIMTKSLLVMAGETDKAYDLIGKSIEGHEQTARNLRQVAMADISKKLNLEKLYKGLLEASVTTLESVGDMIDWVARASTLLAPAIMPFVNLLIGGLETLLDIGSILNKIANGGIKAVAGMFASLDPLTRQAELYKEIEERARKITRLEKSRNANSTVDNVKKIAELKEINAKQKSIADLLAKQYGIEKLKAKVRVENARLKTIEKPDFSNVKLTGTAPIKQGASSSGATALTSNGGGGDNGISKELDRLFQIASGAEKIVEDSYAKREALTLAHQERLIQMEIGLQDEFAALITEGGEEDKAESALEKMKVTAKKEMELFKKTEEFKEKLRLSAEAGNKKSLSMIQKLNDSQRDKSIKNSEKMAFAALSSFKQGSDAAKTANEVLAGLSLLKQAREIIEITTMGVKAVIKQLSEGDVWTALFRAAAVAATVAGYLSNFAGGGGGGSSSGGSGAPRVDPNIQRDLDISYASTEKSMELLNNVNLNQLTELRGLNEKFKVFESAVSKIGAVTIQDLGFSKLNISTEIRQTVLDAMNTVSNIVSFGNDNLSAWLEGKNNQFAKLGEEIVGGKKTSKIKDQGLTFEGSLSDLISKQFQTIQVKTSGGWFGKTKKELKTRTEFLDAELVAPISESLKKGEQVIKELSKTLGLSVEDIGSIELEKLTIKTRGKTQDSINKEITDWVNRQLTLSVGQAFKDDIQEFRRYGESWTEVATRLAIEKETVVDAFRSIGLETQRFGADMIRVSTDLISSAGGIDSFSSGMENYRDNFVSNAIKSQELFEKARELANSLNGIVPETRADFTEMFNQVTNSYNTETMGKLIQNMDLINSYYTEVEKQEEERAESARKIAETAINAAKDQANKYKQQQDRLRSEMIKGLNLELSTKKKAVASLNRLYKSLKGLIIKEEASIKKSSGSVAQLRALTESGNIGSSQEVALEFARGAVGITEQMFATRQEYNQAVGSANAAIEDAMSRIKKEEDGKQKEVDKLSVMINSAREQSKAQIQAIDRVTAAVNNSEGRKTQVKGSGAGDGRRDFKAEQERKIKRDIFTAEKNQLRNLAFQRGGDMELFKKVESGATSIDQMLKAYTKQVTKNGRERTPQILRTLLFNERAKENRGRKSSILSNEQVKRIEGAVSTRRQQESLIRIERNQRMLQGV